MPETPNPEGRPLSVIRAIEAAVPRLDEAKKQFEENVRGMENLLSEAASDYARGSIHRLAEHQDILKRSLGKGLEWMDFRVHLCFTPRANGLPSVSIQCSVDENKAKNPAPMLRAKLRVMPQLLVAEGFGMVSWLSRLKTEFPGEGDGRLWTDVMDLPQAMRKASEIHQGVQKLTKQVERYVPAPIRDALNR